MANNDKPKNTPVPVPKVAKKIEDADPEVAASIREATTAGIIENASALAEKDNWAAGGPGSPAAEPVTRWYSRFWKWLKNQQGSSF